VADRGRRYFHRPTEGRGPSPELLLCGGTGALGGRIAARLAGHGIRFRALVRASSDTAGLQSLGAELRVGNLTDRASLDRAVSGIRTVVTTANSMTSGACHRSWPPTGDLDLTGDVAMTTLQKRKCDWPRWPTPRT
jgi:hypothetical protein